MDLYRSLAIDAELEQQYKATATGRINELKKRLHVLLVEHKETHPVAAVMKTAREALFRDE